MDELSNKIKNLIVDLLTKEFRTHSGEIKYDAQAEWIYHLSKTEDIRELFEYKEEKNGSSKYHYRASLKSLIENRNDYYINSANNIIRKTIVAAIAEACKRLGEEYIIRSESCEIKELKSQVIRLQSEIEYGKPPEKVNLWDKLNSRVNLPYFVMLTLTVVLLLGLIVLGIASTMSVNIEFNIGEIIGGLLIGTGAAAAGISYATRKSPEKNRENQY